ncbi:MAG: hypothetical protein JKY14_00125, partial [Paraglaciecola sp.]|nr:hypothetical protein [Paraglaciecola sp.]
MPKNVGITFGLICLSLTACDDIIINLDGERHVRVYQDDLAPACDSSGAISVKTHGKLLIDENVELHCSQKGHDGYSYTESCNSETDSINIFTIHDKDLAKAESLGFSRLSTLPDAQFDAQCESKVMSDARKYSLINQLDEQYSIWKANKTPNYQFQFNLNFSDCPTFAPTPPVTITVSDDAINTVYDINNDTFLTNISDYMTIDELFSELNLQLNLTAISAGLNATEPLASPIFSNMGIPQQYFINAGGKECDAANYITSDLELI